MGTNYYARVIPTRERRAYLRHLIEENNWTKIRNEINYTYGSFEVNSDDQEIRGEIHLGKRSGGWKFLWNPNIYILYQGHPEYINNKDGSRTIKWIQDPDKYFYIYPLTKDGIKSFIDREDVEIYDEYDEIQDKEEFFKMAIEWVTWNNKPAYDGKSYHAESPNEKVYYQDNKYIQALTNEGFKVEWPFTDFYSDGLRFSTSLNFS